MVGDDGAGTMRLDSKETLYVMDSPDDGTRSHDVKFSSLSLHDGRAGTEFADVVRGSRFFGGGAALFGGIFILSGIAVAIEAVCTVTKNPLPGPIDAFLVESPAHVEKVARKRPPCCCCGGDGPAPVSRAWGCGGHPLLACARAAAFRNPACLEATRINAPASAGESSPS